MYFDFSFLKCYKNMNTLKSINRLTCFKMKFISLRIHSKSYFTSAIAITPTYRKILDRLSNIPTPGMFNYSFRHTLPPTHAGPWSSSHMSRSFIIVSGPTLLTLSEGQTYTTPTPADPWSSSHISRSFI